MEVTILDLPTTCTYGRHSRLVDDSWDTRFTDGAGPLGCVELVLPQKPVLETTTRQSKDQQGDEEVRDSGKTWRHRAAIVAQPGVMQVTEKKAFER